MDTKLNSKSNFPDQNLEHAETEVEGTKLSQNPESLETELQNPEIRDQSSELSNPVEQNSKLLDLEAKPSEQPEFQNPNLGMQNPELTSIEAENPDFSYSDQPNLDSLNPDSSVQENCQSPNIQQQIPELSNAVIQSPDFSNSEAEILDLLKSNPNPDSSEVKLQSSELPDQTSEPSNIQETELSEVQNSETEYLVENEEAVIVIGSDTNIDEEVIALVQASVELISQQEEFNSPKSSEPQSEPFELSEPENFEFYESLNQEIPTSMAQVEVEVEPEFKPSKDGSTIFLIHGVDSTIDFCPNCKTKLCPFRGGYSVNCVNFDVTLQCYECGKNIVIKKLFNLHQKNVLWMNSV